MARKRTGLERGGVRTPDTSSESAQVLTVGAEFPQCTLEGGGTAFGVHAPDGSWVRIEGIDKAEQDRLKASGEAVTVRIVSSEQSTRKQGKVINKGIIVGYGGTPQGAPSAIEATTPTTTGTTEAAVTPDSSRDATGESQESASDALEIGAIIDGVSLKEANEGDGVGFTASPPDLLFVSPIGTDGLDLSGATKYSVEVVKVTPKAKGAGFIYRAIIDSNEARAAYAAKGKPDTPGKPDPKEKVAAKEKLEVGGQFRGVQLRRDLDHTGQYLGEIRVGRDRVPVDIIYSSSWLTDAQLASSKGFDIQLIEVPRGKKGERPPVRAVLFDAAARDAGSKPEDDAYLYGKHGETLEDFRAAKNDYAYGAIIEGGQLLSTIETTDTGIVRVRAKDTSAGAKRIIIADSFWGADPRMGAAPDAPVDARLRSVETHTESLWSHAVIEEQHALVMNYGALMAAFTQWNPVLDSLVSNRTKISHELMHGQSSIFDTKAEAVFVATGNAANMIKRMQELVVAARTNGLDSAAVAAIIQDTQAAIDAADLAVREVEQYLPVGVEAARSPFLGNVDQYASADTGVATVIEKLRTNVAFGKAAGLDDTDFVVLAKAMEVPVSSIGAHDIAVAERGDAAYSALRKEFEQITVKPLNFDTILRVNGQFNSAAGAPEALRIDDGQNYVDLDPSKKDILVDIHITEENGQEFVYFDTQRHREEKHGRLQEYQVLVRHGGGSSTRIAELQRAIAADQQRPYFRFTKERFIQELGTDGLSPNIDKARVKETRYIHQLHNASLPEIIQYIRDTGGPLKDAPLTFTAVDDAVDPLARQARDIIYAKVWEYMHVIADAAGKKLTRNSEVAVTIARLQPVRETQNAVFVLHTPDGQDITVELTGDQAKDTASIEAQIDTINAHAIDPQDAEAQCILDEAEAAAEEAERLEHERERALVETAPLRVYASGDVLNSTRLTQFLVNKWPKFALQGFSSDAQLTLFSVTPNGASRTWVEVGGQQFEISPAEYAALQADGIVEAVDTPPEYDEYATAKLNEVSTLPEVSIDPPLHIGTVLRYFGSDNGAGLNGGVQLVVKTAEHPSSFDFDDTSTFAPEPEFVFWYKEAIDRSNGSVSDTATVSVLGHEVSSEIRLSAVEVARLLQAEYPTTPRFDRGPSYPESGETTNEPAPDEVEPKELAILPAELLDPLLDADGTAPFESIYKKYFDGNRLKTNHERTEGAFRDMNRKRAADRKPTALYPNRQIREFLGIRKLNKAEHRTAELLPSYQEFESRRTELRQYLERIGENQVALAALVEPVRELNTDIELSSKGIMNAFEGLYNPGPKAQQLTAEAKKRFDTAKAATPSDTTLQAPEAVTESDVRTQAAETLAVELEKMRSLYERLSRACSLAHYWADSVGTADGSTPVAPSSMSPTEQIRRTEAPRGMTPEQILAGIESGDHTGAELLASLQLQNGFVWQGPTDHIPRGYQCEIVSVDDATQMVTIRAFDTFGTPHETPEPLLLPYSVLIPGRANDVLHVGAEVVSTTDSESPDMNELQEVSDTVPQTELATLVAGYYPETASVEGMKDRFRPKGEALTAVSKAILKRMTAHQDSSMLAGLDTYFLHSSIDKQLIGVGKALVKLSGPLEARLQQDPFIERAAREFLFTIHLSKIHRDMIEMAGADAPLTKDEVRTHFENINTAVEALRRLVDLSTSQLEPTEQAPGSASAADEPPPPLPSPESDEAEMDEMRLHLDAGNINDLQRLLTGDGLANVQSTVNALIQTAQANGVIKEKLFQWNAKAAKKLFAKEMQTISKRIGEYSRITALESFSPQLRAEYYPAIYEQELETTEAIARELNRGVNDPATFATKDAMQRMFIFISSSVREFANIVKQYEDTELQEPPDISSLLEDVDDDTNIPVAPPPRRTPDRTLPHQFGPTESAFVPPSPSPVSPRQESAAVAEQAEGVYKEFSVESPTEPEKSRELAARIVLADGGVNVHISARKEVSDSAYQTGFQNLTTSINVEPHRYPANEALDQIEAQLVAGNSLTHGERRDDVLKKHGVNEVIDIRHLTKQVEEEVSPAKKGFLGFGAKRAEKRYRQEPVFHNKKVVNGKEEPAIRFTYYIPQTEWQDYSGRPGQSMMVDIILPESKGKELEKIIERDPTAMRKIVERVMKEKILKNPSDWEAEQLNGDPLRPPYEQWDSSGAKIYLQKEGSAPGFHEDNMHEVQK